MSSTSPLVESDLGEKVSFLFRIAGDPKHPFSEVVGLLQRIQAEPGGVRTFAVLRRDGSVVEVREPDVVRFKRVPTRSTPARVPGWWPEARRARPPTDP